MATRDIQLAPLTGVMDLRSSVDLMPGSSVRLRQNLQTVGEGKLRRGSGWSKLLSRLDYNNQDLHDQLTHFAGIRQPITLLTEADSTSGSRSLFAATQGKIMRLSQHGGNWKVLGSGYGGVQSTSASAPRFRSAQVGDYVAFTNDYDQPVYHILDQQGENGETLYQFTDLQTLNVTRAKHIWAWRNFLIFADIEMDGQRWPYRLLSSDFDNPTSFDPLKADSIAWQKDLMTNEVILGGAPSGNSFLIYTNKGIWEMTIVGGDATVNFRRAYNAEDNEMKGTLAYPGLLVNTPEGNLYAGRDGLYLFTPYMSKPDRPEWLHRSTPLIFDRIDASACDVHVTGVYGDEILMSIAEQGSNCPNVTLRINLTYKVCDKLDAGFTAYTHYTPQDIQTVRDFIVENRICTLAGVAGLGFGYVNEGLPNPLPAGNAAFEPMSIHTRAVLQLGGTITVASAGTAAANGSYVWNYATSRYVKISNGYYILTTTDGTTRTWKLYTNGNSLLYSNTATVGGTWSTANAGSNPKPAVTLGADVVTTEDYEQTANDADSLCALLGSEILDAGCRGCKVDPVFVGASSADWSLKEIGRVFYRETCANPTAVGSTTSDGYVSAVGNYSLDPYSSIWRTAPMFVKNAGVQAEHLELDCLAVAQTPPSGIALRVGISAQPADPNTDECRLIWHQRSTRPLKCMSPATVEQHLKRGTMPSDTVEWQFFHKGKFLYFELRIDGTGGDATFSRITSDIARYEITRY